MKYRLRVIALTALMVLTALDGFAQIKKFKDHDFIPRYHNIIFLMDVSDSMTMPYRRNFDLTRLYVATRALELFNRLMPHVPEWQYTLNATLLKFGDCDVPKMATPLSPWVRTKFEEFYPFLRKEGFGTNRAAGFQEGLQLAGQIAAGADGRTAIVVFSDGGSVGECPQRTAKALKDKLGDKVAVFGVYFGETEGEWRNLYEVCKLTGGYCRAWDEVADCEPMQTFAYDILVREIMFPYPEIFFQAKKHDLLPSEALKLESVANFLHAIPQYCLQIDGHTSFFGDTKDNYNLGMERAKSVKHALTSIYNIDPKRVLVRSWGEELPRYDNENPELVQRNRQANLYLMLPLRNFPYDEKNLHTYGVKAVGNIYNTQERFGDTEWAWPDQAPPGEKVPIAAGNRRK
jgi:outer membrane protein OmpA-like peptidoglycan-associated protein